MTSMWNPRSILVNLIERVSHPLETNARTVCEGR
jgi:hypothetical protein